MNQGIFSENDIEKDIIRPMCEADVDRMAVLEKLCFRTPWSRASIAGELKNKAAHYLVCERAGEVIGYAGMWVIMDEAHITNVAVDPLHRREGLGRRIMLCMMRAAALFGAERMTLEVRENNIPAQTLYLGLGFTKAGERKGYYFDTGEAAHIMWNNDIALTLKNHGVII